MILYEYPFNERLRTYLRLEQLFRRLGELIPRPHALDHHFALVTIFEIMDVAARADLKSDVLKDIEKHKHQLDTYRGNPSISEAALDAVISQLDRCFVALNTQSGKSGHALTENDWLMSIRSRIGIPGGTCGFDLPAYYAWQHHPRRCVSRPWRNGPPRWRPSPSRSMCCSSCCAIQACPKRSLQNADSFSRTCPRAAPSSCCGFASTQR